MSKNYFEVRLVSAIDAGELLGMLDDPTCLGACETPDGFCLYWPGEFWNEKARCTLKEALRRLGDERAGDTLAVVELAERDWNRRWAEALQPIRLGRRILIRQSWNAAEAPPGGFELVIDPKRAFGTGYHATTQLMVEMLEEAICGGERLLDIGTGSGILAMVGLRLGAGSALGIDCDPEAIECAVEYAGINGFGPELELRVGRPEDLGAEQFDVVVANLDSRTLLSCFTELRSTLRRCGILLISGILHEDYPEIAEALNAAGWAERSRRERDEWLALALRKVNSQRSLL